MGKTKNISGNRNIVSIITPQISKTHKSPLDEFNFYYENADINNPKIKFYYLCFQNIKKFRNITLPNIKQQSHKEAVLIEHRKFPHLELLIRNTIYNLGSDWSYTVMCGSNNYEFIKDMCKNINENINIINTGFENLTQAEYSDYMCTKDFWNLLHGEKILIYQDDTLIFKKNIDKFLQWDYIGAPFSVSSNDTPNKVGNGGLSIRTKKVMLEVIDRIKVQDTKVNSSTSSYMSTKNLINCPEDIYFSKNIQELSVGTVSDYKTALIFSSETIYSENVFGMHAFWICSPPNRWEQKITRYFGTIY